MSAAAHGEADRRTERRFVLGALALVVLGVLGLAAADALRHVLAAEPPARIAEVRRCFAQERGALVFDVNPGTPGEGASLGAIRTTVEQNGLTFAIAGTEAEAVELAARAAAGPGPPAAVERRGDIVLIWERPPSPTQQQAAYDCSH